MSVAVDMRRGWCPDMLHPMPTGDGLLVRLHPRGAMLSAAQAHAIADGANRFGNGHLDVSSRGNIQIRGVTPASHPQLVESLISAGMMKGVRAESPYRLTTISPLAGIDPADRVDAFALAERIEQIGSSLKGIARKVFDPHRRRRSDQPRWHRCGSQACGVERHAHRRRPCETRWERMDRRSRLNRIVRCGWRAARPYGRRAAA